MTKSSKITLSIIGIVILAFVGGLVGAKASGGSSDSSATASKSLIKEIKKRGELRVGVAESAPMSTVAKGPDGKTGGPMVIPLRNLAKQLHVKFTVVPATWSNIAAGLQAGRYDFAAYLDNTLERATSIQFSNPVLTYQAVLVVKQDSPYTKSADVLEGHTIAAAAGSAFNGRVAELGGKLLALDNNTNCVAALKAGRADAIMIDLPAAEGLVQTNPSLKIIVPDPVIYQSGAGYGVPEDTDPRSLQLINIAILDAQDYGEMSAAYSRVKYRELDNLGDWLKK